MQVQLPVAMKANTQEAGADVKESGIFSDAGHLEDGGLTSQRDPHLYSSIEIQAFIRRKKGTEQKDQERRLKSSLRAGEHSPF